MGNLPEGIHRGILKGESPGGKLIGGNSPGEGDLPGGISRNLEIYQIWIYEI